jgi:hypothetical protein
MQNKILEKIGMIHTPENMESLMRWIESLGGGERAVAMVAAGMAWNLAAATVDAHERRQEDGRREVSA